MKKFQLQAAQEQSLYFVSFSISNTFFHQVWITGDV